MPERPTILIAEDDELVLALFRRLLASKGWEVTPVTNGYDALRAWKERDGYDLAILDVRMPKMDGYTAYRQMRELTPGAQFMFVSGYSNETIEFQVHDIDGMHYLHKPFDSIAFLNLVQQLLQTRNLS